MAKKNKYGAKVVGSQFGRLKAVSYLGRKGKDALYLCQCQCGKTKEILLGNLRNGSTQSCGCLRAEQMARKPRNKTHGMTETKEFRAWTSMRSRCSSSTSAAFKNYGAKGISVCYRWQTFENFFADMGPAPSPSHSIDRIDGSGNYTPENCRWATPVQQSRNLKSNLRFTIGNETRCLSEWCEIKALPYSRVKARLNKGLPIEKALLGGRVCAEKEK